MTFRSEVLRLDRMVTLGLVAPLQECFGYRTRGIPILMYHSISDDLEAVSHPYYATTTSPRTFALHMEFLFEHGYTVLPLQEALDSLKDDSKKPMKIVALTFDDGFADFYDNAFPVLHKYAFPSTVFLATAFNDDQQKRFKGKRCLSWNEARALRKQGVIFGSHTQNHPKLVTLGWDQIHEEVFLSKQEIESQLGEPINAFCYPYAFPDEDKDYVSQLIETLHSAGYIAGLTTKIGFTSSRDHPLCLRRIPVNDHDDLNLFSRKIQGAYNWVYCFQKSVKSTRRMLGNSVRSQNNLSGTPETNWWTWVLR